MIYESMIKVCVIGIVSVIFILVLKRVSPNMALILSLITSILIFLFIFPFISQIIELFKTFTLYIDYKSIHLDIVLKILCISYICEFSSELCKDAGENSIASKIELSGKVLIMVLSVPIITEILKTVVTIL